MTLPLLLTLLALCTLHGQSFQAEFFAARKIQDTDRDAALEGMKRCFDLSIAAGNADYATAAGNQICFWIHDRGKVVEAGHFARKVIAATQPLIDPENFDDAFRRAILFGFIERGLMEEGKIGEAWRANRLAAENLRGNPIGLDGDGASITLQDLKDLPAKHQSVTWRLVEREADLLDHMGRTLDARALLDGAAAIAGDRWPSFSFEGRFYVFKLLSSRCMLIDFIGYDEEAIEAQKHLLTTAKDLPVQGSYQTLRINFLRNLSQWSGPTEEILMEAREVAATNESGPNGNSIRRLLAKMELDLRQSKEAMGTLRDSARTAAGLGHFLEAAYADRDSLVSRAKEGETALDPEFISVLTRMRAQGNKRGEPSIYKEYGDYLVRQDRPAEALPLYQEALRMKRAFGLWLHEPALLSAIFNTRHQCGDVVGAEAALAELVAWLRAYRTDAPVARRVHAEILRASALATLGRIDEAKAALELARTLGANLPPYRRMLLEPDQEHTILHPAPTATPAVTPLPPLQIQPLEVATTMPPGQPATTRFTVTNPAGNSVRGEWIFTGPEATASSASVRFTGGRPFTEVRIPQSVPGAGEATIETTFIPADGISAAKVAARFQPAAGAATTTASWEILWKADPGGRIILDASALQTNPFRSVSLFHEVAIPTGLASVPFRLRSPIPLRFEYYDSTGNLLAVDANGNGDFTETGDLHSQGPTGIASAIIPGRFDRPTSTLEICIFAPTGEPLAITPSLVLESEVHRGGQWIKEAESILK